MLSLANFIDPDRVKELHSTECKAALEELCGLIKDPDLLSDSDVFFQKVYEREQESSTAMGLGIAIPHARLSSIKENFITIGRSRDGIPFDAPDGAPVHIIFLVGVSSNQSQYLQIIQRISWLVRNDELRQELIQAPSIDVFYRLLSEH